MKTSIILLLCLALFAGVSTSTLAQTTPSGATWSGQITYEAVRKIDPSSMRIVINGEQVKPGDPNFPSDIPDTRTFGQQVSFGGKYAQENRDEQNAMVRRIVEDGRPPQTTPLSRPFSEQVFVHLKDQNVVTVLTVGKEKDAKTYRADVPIARVSGWQFTDQTKKIAGFTCRKATVPYRNETYTVWVTTDLPMTYSPIHELTPETGTVLLIEGGREQFRATKVSNTAPAVVGPTSGSQIVTAAQLAEIRQKAIADFQQQMMMGERN